MATSNVLQTPKAADAYQLLYDSLGDAYWEASDISSKDLVYGLQESIGQILTAIDQQDLANNTAVFISLGAQIQATNVSLKKVQDSIDSITKNIQTAGKVMAAIATILSLFP